MLLVESYCDYEFITHVNQEVTDPFRVTIADPSKGAHLAWALEPV